MWSIENNITNRVVIVVNIFLFIILNIILLKKDSEDARTPSLSQIKKRIINYSIHFKLQGTVIPSGVTIEPGHS